MDLTRVPIFRDVPLVALEALAAVGSGDVVGEVGATRGGVRRGTVVAAEDMRVLTVSIWSLCKVADQYPVLLGVLGSLARSRA